MLLDLGLDKECAPVRVETGAQPVDDHIHYILGYFARIGIIARQGMPVGNEIETLISSVVLQLHPVLEGAVIISQVQFARGPHAAQNSLFRHLTSANPPSVMPIRLGKQWHRGGVVSMLLTTVRGGRITERPRTVKLGGNITAIDRCVSG